MVRDLQSFVKTVNVTGKYLNVLMVLPDMRDTANKSNDSSRHKETIFHLPNTMKRF